MINFHLLLGRRHGSSEGVPLMSGFSDDTAALTRAYEDITGPKVAEFAKEFAEVLFVSNGIVLANHDFPDPSEVEAQRKRKALAEAREILAENDLAKAQLAEVKSRVEATAATLKQLSPEQKQLLAEDAAAKAKAEAEAKRLADAEAKARADADADAAARAAETKAAQDRAAARDTFIAELSSQSDEQLHTQCVAAKLECLPNESRETFLALLVKAAGF